MKKILLAVVMMLIASSANAQDIQLVQPQISGGKPLMDVIKSRRSERLISSEMLSQEDLSNLLWATWGISSDDGKRVVPTALNKQNIELYVLLDSGVYIYDAANNLLKLVDSKDLRPSFGASQPYAANAPVHLLFVTDDKKFGDMHAGSMYQNAFLYCASEGLACVVRGAYDREEAQKALKLDGDKEVVITFVAGYKEEK